MAENWAETARTVEYRKNVELALRQEPGILFPLAGSSAPYKGKGIQLIDRFGTLKLEKKRGRNVATNTTDQTIERRWIKKPGLADLAVLIDPEDADSTSVDIKSPIVMATAEAVRKYHDDQFLLGFWGSGYTGEDGAGTVAFTATNKVAVNFGGSNVGLTKAKLIELRRKMSKANAFVGDPIILLDPDAEADLFGINEYVSFDFNDSRPLVKGEVKPWLGFRFMKANLLDADAFPESSALFQVGGVNRLPVIVPRGLHRGVWNEFKGRIGERADLSYSEQIYAAAESAVVRTDEKLAWFIETNPAA